MFKIVKKEKLTSIDTALTIHAPNVTKKAEPGQFIILRVDEDGERIPLTIADYDRETGYVTIIYHIVGATTQKLESLNEGDYILDFVGPLGNPTETNNINSVAIIGGGVGCAIAYPLAKKFHALGSKVHSIIGFRNKDYILLEKEFEKVSDKLFTMTDDGSYKEKGFVTDALRKLLESGEKYDEVIAIGPIPMMKFVSKLTKEYGIKTVVSMNPIMIDGTGMCGGCRLTVDGVTKFACVDGPDFDGHKVDFDELMQRNNMYSNEEAHARESTCNLLKKEVK